MEKIVSDTRALGNRVKSLEKSYASHRESLDFLHQDLTDYKKTIEEEMNSLKGKLDDQENLARRQNLRLVGFPEGVEGNDPTACIQNLLAIIEWAWRKTIR